MFRPHRYTELVSCCHLTSLSFFFYNYIRIAINIIHTSQHRTRYWDNPRWTTLLVHSVTTKCRLRQFFEYSICKNNDAKIKLTLQLLKLKEAAVVIHQTCPLFAGVANTSTFLARVENILFLLVMKIHCSVYRCTCPIIS